MGIFNSKDFCDIIELQLKAFCTEVIGMANQFLTNYTETTFLEKIKDNLRHCSAFSFSVSFIKKAGLVLLWKDIEAAV